MSAGFLSELRTAGRGLRRTPTSSLSAVLCLALGIGATTAIFSAIQRALLQPLPFRAPERLVSVHRITPQSGPRGWSQSPANYIDLRDRASRIQGLAAVTWGSAVIELPDDPLQVSTHRVTGNFFETLGARAQMGRLLQSTDDRADAADVAVISHELWRTSFGSDPGIVGRTLPISGKPTTILGVLPRDFRVPLGQNIFRADLWVPMRFTPEEAARRRNNFLQTMGRLAPGATVENAQAELQTIFATMIEANPHLRGDNVRVAELQAENVGPLRKPLFLLLGAVGLVLLIAATNVAALLLARGVQRRREIAVRAALGATAADTMRLALVEGLVLSVLGALLGIVLSLVAVKSIGILAAQKMPQLDGLRLNPSVLAFGLALTAVVAVLCSAVPALRSARVSPQDALRGGRGGGAGREHHRALRGLVVVEIAVSLVLLIGAGLSLKGFAQLIGADSGFDASRILTFRVTVPASRYPDGANQKFLRPAIDAMQRVPGVEAASDISAIPYAVWGNNSGIRYEGMPSSDQTRWPIVEQRRVSPEFFAVTRQRLLAGRQLSITDDDKSPYVVVVNQALVKRDLNGQDPIGKRFHLGDTTFGTIVGVVSDIRNMGPYRPAVPEMYLTQNWNSTSYGFMVRARAGDPAVLAPDLRRVIRQVDPSAAVADIRTMEEVISRSLGEPRFYFTLLGAFAAVAIVLAVAGLYGVLSYAVAQRTREIGIRTALGSTRGMIARLVALEGFRLVVTGMAIGLIGGAALTRLMQFMLYGVSPLDAWTWAGAALLMSVVAMTAALIPASRASRVDPLIAMRAE